METLNHEQMVDYLKKIVDLEASVYTQKQSNEIAHENLVFEPVVEEVPDEIEGKPKREFVPVPTARSKSAETIMIILSITGIILFVATYALIHYGHFFYCWLTFILASFSFILASIVRSDNPKVTNEEILNAKNKMKIAQEKYDEEYAVYQEKLDMAREKVRKRNEAEEQKAKKNYEVAEQLVEKMDSCLEESCDLLENLYNSQDIIFPKYRNLVAISTIYEYFVSGRVDKLEGPDGAYNLYESELRQNIIINNLSVIATNIENIKNNQYILYTEIKNTNEIMNRVENEIKSVLVNTQTIANSSYILTACTKINAENTALLTGMQLGNSLLR